MENNVFKIGIIYDSTQDEKFCPQIAKWVQTFYNNTETTYEIIDLKDYQLTLENISSNLIIFEKWKTKVESQDAFVFITQEYSHYTVSSLKNAMLLTRKSWYKKVAGIISYGSSDGKRAFSQLKDLMEELKMTNVRLDISLTLFNDFQNDGTLNLKTREIENISLFLEQVNNWGKASLALNIFNQ